MSASATHLPGPRATSSTESARRSRPSAPRCWARRRTCCTTPARSPAAALLAGISGQMLFGAPGFLLVIPLLNRLRRRHDSWAVPVGVLAVMAAVFTFSSLAIGPTLADSGGGSTTPTTNSVPSAPPGVSPEEHEAHHR
jgi:hypothetical protein